MIKIQKYGWRPQLPDIRDLKLSAPSPSIILPAKIDLRPSDPGIYDQGQLGSCTANAVGAMFEAELKKQGLIDFRPSRLFEYFNSRLIEGDTSADNGAQLRDAMKAIATYGVCPESEWPYIENQFSVKPTAACYADALKNKAIQYLAIDQDIIHLKACLASGYRFVMGITVYDSFEGQEVAQTGMVTMPGPDESAVGGHAVCVVGYDDSNGHFIVRNSWGTSWGDAGYFYLPYDYVLDENLATDFWSSRLVS